MIGDEVLVPPAPGETLTLGAFTVRCRVCKCCPGSTPTYVVRDGHGELVAMAKTFRLLAHYRRWQLDPMTALTFRKDGEPVIRSEPPGWPVDDMNAWQKLCWYLARNDLALGDIAYPITRVHPDYVQKRKAPAQAKGPEPEPPPVAARVPTQKPRGPTLPRGPADDAGQFSLWE